MQPVKTEELPAPSAADGSACRLCLSTERRTSSVESVSYAYGLVTDWAPQAGARVCWECRARLEGLLRFKLQAVQALQLLESAQSLGSGASFTSLGKHTITTYDDEVVYDADLHTEISLKPSKHTSGDFTIEIAKQENLYEDEFAIDIAKQENLHEEDFVIKVAEQENLYEDEICDCDTTADAVDEIETNALSLKKSDINPTSTPNMARLKAKDKHKKKPAIKYITEKFTPTDEELSSYREMALLNLKMHTFKCVTCIIGFPSKGYLKRHNETLHSETAGCHVCDVCECRFQSEEALAKHRASHLVLYRCKYPGCDFVHPLNRIVRKHYSIHAQGDDKCTNKTEIEHEHLLKKISAQSDSYECDYCGKNNVDIVSVDHKYRYTNKTEIEHEHLLKKISAQHDSYECDYCGKSFILRKKMIAHIKQHILKFVCEMCGRMFSSKQHLKHHMLAHLDPSHRQHGCNICQKRFTTKHKLLIHTRSHTGERPFKCENCSRAFSCKDALKCHMKARHLLSEEKKRFFRTPPTKSLFINKRQFPCSKLSQNGKFVCNICGIELLSYEDLQTHFAGHDGKPYHCNSCDKKFKYRSELDVHIKVVHRREKPYTCTTCGAKFSIKALRDNHLLSHSNNRTYKCDECDASFKYNSGLWTHKLTHKGEKPHQCTICGSRFTIKGILKGHMKTHSNEKPFECDVCGRKFPWKRNLKNHFKTHSKEQQL